MLPFTGLDLALWLLAGVASVAAGAGLRKKRDVAQS